MNCGFAFLVLLLASAPPGGTLAAAGGTMSETLVDFRDADRPAWVPILDGVMGGVSQGGIRRTEDGTGVFSGMLSLENKGGFASVRTALGPRDLSAYDGLEIRVRGDGRTYQLRLRTDAGFDGVAYRSEFETAKGEWITKRLPFAAFLPTFRGRVLPDAPPLDRSHVQQLGLMLADGKPGPFSLEIDFARTWEAMPVNP